jgi:hypothetical protein
MPPAASLGSRAGLVNKCNRWPPKAAPDQQLRSFSKGQLLLLLGSRGRSTCTFQQVISSMAIVPAGRFSEGPIIRSDSEYVRGDHSPSQHRPKAAHPDFAYST